MTKVRGVDVDRIEPGSPAADCLRAQAPDVRPLGRVVDRIGVSGQTVTLRAASGVYGCDDSPGPRELGRRWCGRSFGRLYAGRLRDPRLDIAGCRTADGDVMGFAWVEPAKETRYLAVSEPGYAEVYEAAGGLPIRIVTTGGVQIEGSRATFEISEHDDAGDVLRRYRLDAVVAG